MNVTRKGAAARAGLRGVKMYRNGRYELGDVIVGINQHRIDNFDDLYNTLDRYRAGDNVTVHYVRDGREESVKLDLIEVN